MDVKRLIERVKNCRQKTQKTQNLQHIVQLCDTVREIAFSINKYHKHG